MSLNPVAKESLQDLADALEQRKGDGDTGSQTIADFVNQLLAEPDRKKRKQMMKEFSARRADVARFIRDNEEIINAEAEMALVAAAVGTTVTEKEISYKGGRRTVSTKRKHIPPNVGALNLYLKNKMPDKYSDKPQTEPEFEDVSETEEDIYGGE
ncbi:MAG: hypothetical protein J6C96_03950 [Oscillospiraceae bacterium]|nr:hypothetical protein [Oscillospiraceae bacterium]